MGRAAAAALLMLSLSAGAAAQETAQAAYGGSGEDILLEAVSCGDGLFAAGTTASDDYDLAMRTRSGETGWALRLSSDGAVRFSFLSGHSGMTRMCAPAAFEDGTYAMVLTDEEGQRGEFITLDARGKAISRLTLPEADVICPDAALIRQMLPVMEEEGAALVLLAEHADGTLCCACMHADGRIENGATLEDEARGLGAAGRGVIAYASMQEGGFALTYAAPGSAQTERITAQTDFEAVTIEDMLLGEDESAVLCGEARGGGYLLRVSRAGEVLFAQRTDAPVMRLTGTETGFAALMGAEILFTDEDGTGMASVSAPENTLDLAPSLGGAAALSHLPQRGRRQAVFTHVAQPALSSAPQETAEEKAEAMQQVSGEFALEEGYLVCSASDASGVQVTHMDEDGTPLFTTRTPIHTAADRLQWCCAAVLRDGSILLGGRYLSGEGEAQSQQAVWALLSAGGVLRRMETMEGAGAVCAVEIAQDGSILLHAAPSGKPSLESSKTVPLAWP